MKILIIGAKGMLGQALCEEFHEGNEVFDWDRDEVDLVEIKNQKSPASPRRSRGRAKIKNLEVDLIINAAAYNDVDKAEQEPEIANLVNGYAVGDLAAICKELDIPLVHYSTDYVFDGAKKQGYVETDQPQPISAYGASKYLGEQELQKNSEKFYLIRPSRLFGKASLPLPNPPHRGEGKKKETSSPLMGEDRGGGGMKAKKSFVELMLELAKSKDEIEVVDEEVSCPTYAPDLAKLTKQIVEQKLPSGIYHGANSGSVTWYGFAKELFKIAKLNVKLVPVAQDRFKRAAQRPKFSILLNTKLPLERPWQEALREFLAQEVKG